MANVKQTQFGLADDEPPSKSTHGKVLRRVKSAPYPQHSVLLHTNAGGLVYIAPPSATTENSRPKSVIATHGVIEVEPGRPFYITVSNFPANDADQPKHMNIAADDTVPVCIIQAMIDSIKTKTHKGT